MSIVGGVPKIKLTQYGAQINQKFIFPFLRCPGTHEHVIARYPKLFNRLICASPNAFSILVNNEVLMAGMNTSIKRRNEPDIAKAFAAGLNVRHLGKDNKYFVIVLSGEEAMGEFLKDFFYLRFSHDLNCRKIFEMAFDKMNKEPVD